MSANKQVYISVRVTAEEKLDVIQSAKSKGKRLSDYVRSRILRAKPNKKGT